MLTYWIWCPNDVYKTPALQTAEKFQSFLAIGISSPESIGRLPYLSGLIAHLDLRKVEYKDEIRKALKERDLDHFHSWLDTYESTLEDTKKLKKVGEFRSYILNN